MIKKMLTFKNTNNYNYYDSHEALQDIERYLEDLKKINDNKTYLITIEQVEDIEDYKK